MSSMARRMELAIGRKRGTVPPRDKATRKAFGGTPHRRCILNAYGDVIHRYT